MPIFHLQIKIISRGKGKSAVAAAAYRAGETIKNEYDGITHDYTRKRGIIHTEILLPENAPAEYSDRAILWNAVEQIEKAKNSQLARELEIALPKEMSISQNTDLVRDYIKTHFVEKGMCADICIHDKNDGNPHAHVMLTMRPFNGDRSWGDKQKKVYHFDGQGNKIYDPKKRQYKCNKVQTTDWHEQTKAEEWRGAWAESVNAALERYGHAERIDHRSYQRQGIEQIPTVHLGAAASRMEKRGIRTERGNLNREIEISNKRLREIKARIAKLQTWLFEEMQNTEPPTLADVISDILSRRQGYHSGTNNLKSAANMLNFLQDNKIIDYAGLEKHLKSMMGKRAVLREELKPIERRIETLDMHIKQAEYYWEHIEINRLYQQQKPKQKERFFESNRAELTLFKTAEKYLRQHLNGRNEIPLPTWKKERGKLTADLNRLNRDYKSLKTEVAEVEKIRVAVYDILSAERRREQPQRAHDLGL